MVGAASSKETRAATAHGIGWSRPCHDRQSDRPLTALSLDLRRSDRQPGDRRNHAVMSVPVVVLLLTPACGSAHAPRRSAVRTKAAGDANVTTVSGIG